MLASELFAMSQEIRLQGIHECHWCGAKCSDKWVHDGPPNLPFVRSSEPAKRIANHYICQSCWVWRKPRVTLSFINNTFQDSECALKRSWWITTNGSWAVRSLDFQELYKHVIKPPIQFCLSLINSGNVSNHLQCMVVNTHPEIRADTPLHYTLNNIPHTYTVYELEEAIKTNDANGTEPGVQALIRTLGPYQQGNIVDKINSVGRPRRQEDKRFKKIS